MRQPHEWVWVYTWGYPNLTTTKSFWGEEGQMFQFYAGTLINVGGNGFVFFPTQTDWTKNLSQVYDVPDTISLTLIVRGLKNVNTPIGNVCRRIPFALQQVPFGGYVKEVEKEFLLVLKL